MAKTTRWFLTRLARLSQVASSNPDIPSQRGFAPAIWEFISHANGLITGNKPNHATGLSLCAVTIDDGRMPAPDIQSLWNALELAPDTRVFDVRESISNPGSLWSRRAQFAAVLESRLFDTGHRMASAGKSIRYIFRELARQMEFYQSLGRHFYPIALDQPLSVIEKCGRDALGDHMLELGWPSSRVPNKTNTFRQFYRAVMDDPLADYGLESGAWHLGDASANLGKVS